MFIYIGSNFENGINLRPPFNKKSRPGRSKRADWPYKMHLHVDYEL